MFRGWEHFLLEFVDLFFCGGIDEWCKKFTPDIHESIPRELLLGKPFCSFCILRTWRWDVYLTSMPCLDLRSCQWTEVFHSEMAWNFRLYLPPQEKGRRKPFSGKTSAKDRVIFGGRWNHWACLSCWSKKKHPRFWLELCSRGKGGRLNSLLKILVDSSVKIGTKLLVWMGVKPSSAIFGLIPLRLAENGSLIELDISANPSGFPGKNGSLQDLLALKWDCDWGYIKRRKKQQLEAGGGLCGHFPIGFEEKGWDSTISTHGIFSLWMI